MQESSFGSGDKRDQRGDVFRLADARGLGGGDHLALSRGEIGTARCREGFEALMNGDDHVVAGSFKNTVQAAAGKIIPERVGAAAHAKMSEPGSGDNGAG